MENSKLLDHTEQKWEAYSISFIAFYVYVVGGPFESQPSLWCHDLQLFCLASLVPSIVSKACTVCCSPLQSLLEEQVAAPSLSGLLPVLCHEHRHSPEGPHFTFYETGKDSNTWSKYVIEDDSSKFQKQSFIPRKVGSWENPKSLSDKRDPSSPVTYFYKKKLMFCCEWMMWTFFNT